MLFLSNQNIILEDVIHEFGDAIAISDKNLVIIGANKKMADMYGISLEKLIGMSAFDVHPEFEKSIFYEAIMSVIKTGNDEMKMGYSTNLKKHILIRAKKLNNVYAMVVYDISEKEDKQIYLKKYDTLTGIPNRFQFEEDIRIENEYKNLFLIDVKQFRILNENVGMKMGDFYLMKVAARLKTILTEGEFIYRLSGDQFLILNCKKEIDYEKRCLEILSVFETQVVVLNKKLKLDITIGAAALTKELEKNSLNCVELALNSAKKNNKDFVIYSKGLETKENKLEMKELILDGLEKNQFELYFQPQGDLLNNKVVGAELLIRWNHPTDGLIAPGLFLPIAKEVGLIKKIDKWVFINALEKIKELKNSNIDIPMSINMTSESLNDAEMQKYIISKLEEDNIKNICFEITETGLMDFETSKDFMTRLKELNNFIAIDDFGTGYCSLEYLLNYSADFLKIERKFVDNIHNSKKNENIFSNIVKLGHSLNAIMIAEGVEKVEELEVLKNNNCDIIQGYLYSKPIKFKEFIEFTKNKGISKLKSNII